MFDVSADYEICSYISIREIKAHIVEHRSIHSQLVTNCMSFSNVHAVK